MKWAIFGMGLLIVLSGVVFADGAVGGALELVQSVPLETTLEVPGIRQTQQVWLEMIESAQRTIDIEQFYLNNQGGTSLQSIVAALYAAAAKGVRVRVLVDFKFFRNYSQEPTVLSHASNFEVRTIDLSPGVQHAKFFIVDESSVYLGSANFDWLALSHIHEVGLRVRDSGIAQNLGLIFAKDWESGVEVARGQKKATAEPGLTPLDGAVSAPSSTGMLFVASPPSRNPVGIPDSLTSILRLLNEAKNSIKIQMYQYSTHLINHDPNHDPNRNSGNWTELDSALRNAAKRGVHVQLIVDAVAFKIGHQDLKSLAEVKNIEVRSVVIPEWSGGHLDYARLIHSKYFTVDGASSWVGTENWVEGYFSESRNVGVLVQSSEIAIQLEQVFHQVWTSAYASPLPSGR